MTLDSNVSHEVLSKFAEAGFEPINVSVGELVTIRMDASYHIAEVSLDNPRADRQQLETALREAFNEALRQVTNRNAERLSALMDREDRKEVPTTP